MSPLCGTKKATRGDALWYNEHVVHVFKHHVVDTGSDSYLLRAMSNSHENVYISIEFKVCGPPLG